MVWYICGQAGMLAVECIPKCMLRIVYEDYDSPYDNLLCKSHMSSQEWQRTRSLATKEYNAVYDMTSSYIQKLFEVKETPYNLRDSWRTIIPILQYMASNHLIMKVIR